MCMTAGILSHMTIQYACQLICYFTRYCIHLSFLILSHILFEMLVHSPLWFQRISAILQWLYANEQTVTLGTLSADCFIYSLNILFCMPSDSCAFLTSSPFNDFSTSCNDVCIFRWPIFISSMWCLSEPLSLLFFSLAICEIICLILFYFCMTWHFLEEYQDNSGTRLAN